MPRPKPFNRWRNPQAVMDLQTHLRSLALSSLDGAYIKLQLGTVSDIIRTLETLQELLAERAELKKRLSPEKFS